MIRIHTIPNMLVVASHILWDHHPDGSLPICATGDPIIAARIMVLLERHGLTDTPDTTADLTTTWAPPTGAVRPAPERHQ